MTVVKIAVFACFLGLVKFIFSILKKEKASFKVDAAKQKEINKIFDEKIEEARKENEKPLTEEEIISELNRYRGLN